MSKGKIHFIAIGGAVMHQLALDMLRLGYAVSGSDDEIYDPALSNLRERGICPEKFGWFPEKINKDLDFIVLGMHARADNPELLSARELGIKIYSYPELVYSLSKNKKRIVIAGSHGKTTTTSMILHVLRKNNMDFDFLVGAKLDGFDRMVRLSEAPILVVEGDEYLSSAIDRVPKIHQYHPHISVLTGIAWDHINVFPTFENYTDQFRIYLKTFEDRGRLFYCKYDTNIVQILNEATPGIEAIPYEGLERQEGSLVRYRGSAHPVSVIGKHNLENMHAALLVCGELGISEDVFFDSIADFTGAQKRLQKLFDKGGKLVYLDFAHSPSKVKATCSAFADWYHDKPLLAVLELHTFSSVSSAFLPEYHHSLGSAMRAIIYLSPHTFAMKQMEMLTAEDVQKAFDHPGLKVITSPEKLREELELQEYKNYHVLMMSSGTFDKLDFSTINF